MNSHIGLGTIEISGTAYSVFNIYKEFNSSWAILGDFESGFISEWGVGEGEYYWYRVEGQCGELKCDTNGIVDNTCDNMTFVTVVGARNLTELCFNLANPVLNPKVDFKLSSIKKYSRPITRSESDLCNVLEEQDFCQVAECLNYCIDQDIVEKISLSMKVIESSLDFFMSGGINLFGQVQTNKNKYYEPIFGFIGNLNGVSESKIIIRNESSSKILFLHGNAKFSLSNYRFESFGNLINIEGFARTVSPSRAYFKIDGGISISGSSRLSYDFNPIGGLEFGGSAFVFSNLNFIFSGKLEVSGKLIDYFSPKFNSTGSGAIYFNGNSEINFVDYGINEFNFDFDMKAFDFTSETYDSFYNSRLTISDELVNTSCGCSQLPLVLRLSNNFSNSSFLSNFARRSSINFSDSLFLRYSSLDSAWRSTQHFLGRGRDGLTIEDLYLRYNLSCLNDFWTFYFYAKTLNRQTKDENYTKFIIDIPSEIFCIDGNISNSIELDANMNSSQPELGESINVVQPGRTFNLESNYGVVDVFVGGIFNEIRLYYDGLGLFKNSYWENNNIQINLNLPSDVIMSEIDMYKIFFK